VKAILAKAEVSSRGELVAKRFAEYYEPVYAVTSSGSSARTELR
jgi:hypothetical protein